MTNHHVRRLAPQFILDRHMTGEQQGRFQAVAMFVDMSGFTRLTETLMQHAKAGAEALTDALNDIFNPIVHEVYARGGMIATFGGDAFTALFPLDLEDQKFDFSEKSNFSDTVYQEALQAAVFVHRFFQENGLLETRYGAFEMAVKVGLSVGELEWGILGSEELRTYYFRGAAIDGCAHAEHLAEKGEIVLTAGLAALVKGWADLEPMPAGEPTSGRKRPGPFRLKALNVNTEAAAPAPPAPERAALAPFVLDEVIDFTQQAEFRTVCSVFISFANPKDEAVFDAFVTTTIGLALNYGGYFNKLDFGDKGGVMLVLFGAPLAYEDNLKRAADYLLALQRQTSGVHWRAGLTYGTVYAGIVGGAERCEYTAIGDIVNLSARLMMKADWGEIWTSQAVYDQIESGYALEALGVFTFKGKGGDIPAYRLRRQLDRASLRLYTGSLVGRQQEIDALFQFTTPIFVPGADHPFPGVMYVFGEPGMGKSRLVYEFRQMVSREQHVRWMFCPAEGILRQSLNPIVYFLRGYFSQSAEVAPDENKARFDQTLDTLFLKLPPDSVQAGELRSELERTRSVLGAMVDLHWPGSLYESLDPKLRFENMLIAFTSLVKAESLIQPVVIEVDDGNLIDSDSEQLFKVLSRDIAGHRVAIIVTTRYNDDGSKAFLNIDAHIPRFEIDLNYLSTEGVKAFAEQVLQAELAESAVRLLADKSNGNPFFIEQMALDLRERDLFLPEPGGTGRLTLPDLHAADVPDSITSVLISRLDRLEADVKHLVQTASVLGREFVLLVLSRMLPDDHDLRSKVTLVEEQDIWSALSDIRFLFKHALLRDSAYEMQLRARLRELHRLAAEAIEVTYAEELPAHYVDLAHHYERAEIAPKARAYLRRAADHTKANYQNAISLSLYERLLKYVAEDDPERPDIFEQRGDINTNISEHDQALAQYMRAMDYLLQHPASEMAPRLPGLYRKVATAHMNKGEYDVSLQWLDMAQKAVPTEDRRELARILTAMSGLFYRQGDANAALARCEEGLHLASHGSDLAELAHAHMVRGTIHTGLGRFDDAVRDYEISLELCQSLGDVLQQCKAANSLGAVYHYKGDWPQAVEHYQHSLGIAEEIGYVDQQATVSNNLGEIYLIRGQFDEAAQRFQSCLSTWRRTGFTLGTALSHRNLAQIRIIRQEWETALMHLEKSLETLADLGSRDWLAAEVYRLAAEVELGMGRLEQARQQCQRSLDIARSQDLKLVEGNALRVLGQLHRQEGQWREAEALLQSSVEMARDLGMRLEQGQALVELALLYEQWAQQDHGALDRDHQQQILDEAMQLFSELDAQWDLARAVELWKRLA